MKILAYSHFFYPEIGAASLRMQYFVKVMRNHHHDVKVITPVPNYPKGKKYDGFKFFCKKDKKNDITYLPIYVSQKHFFLLRGLSYFSYAITSFSYSFFLGSKYDIIVTSSPPILTAFSAAILSKIRRKKFILDLRDIWPDIGLELGILKNKYLIKILTRIEQFIYKTANYIVVTAEGDKENVISKGVLNEKIEVVYNGADINVFLPSSKESINNIRAKYNLPLEKKILIYFGSFNFGMNDIETLGNALSSLENYKATFHFIAVGDGDNCNNFIEKIKKKIDYTHFKNLSNRELATVLSACDFSIIPRKKINRDTGGNIPVKCFESWAAGVPVILSCDNSTEIARIFNECGSGKLIPSGDEELLKNSILQFLNNEGLKKLGELGRLFVKNRYDRGNQILKLINIINNL